VEVVLVQVTSSLTLSVLGVLKTLVQVLIAIFLFGDDLGILKAFGMVITLSGLLGYAFFKHWRKKRDAAFSVAEKASIAAATRLSRITAAPQSASVEMVPRSTAMANIVSQTRRHAYRRRHVPVATTADVGIDSSDSLSDASSDGDSDESSELRQSEVAASREVTT